MRITDIKCLLLVRTLIITVLAYFIGLLFCHCVKLKCGDTIEQLAIKIKRRLTKVYVIVIAKNQATSGSLDMEQLHARIPDVAFN